MKACYHLYFVILFLPLFTSCSEEVEPKPATYSKFLTGEQSKTWRMVAHYMIEKDNPKNKYDYTPQNSCTDSLDIFDNYYTFYANPTKTFEITEGPEKCDFFEEFYLQDYWAFNNASASLTFVFLPLINAAVKVNYTVTELTDRKLVIQFYDEEFNDRFIYQYVLNPIKEN